MITQIKDLLPPLRELHDQIRDAVVTACEQTALDQLATIAKEQAGDTIYAVDKISEELLVDFFTNEIARQTPIVLIAEGLEPGGLAVLPRDSRHYSLLDRAAIARGARIVTFGTTADAYIGAREIKLGDTGSDIVAEIAGQALSYRLGTVGVHIAVNSLAVIATLNALHLPLKTARAPLAGITSPVGRGARTLGVPGRDR